MKNKNCKEKSCWDCRYMRPEMGIESEFWCNQLDQFFDKVSEDDACEDFDPEIKPPKVQVKPSNAAAVAALQVAISNDIELQFIELYGEHGEGCPDNFDYEAWYEVAREVAYNQEYIMTLRNYIGGIE